MSATPGKVCVDGVIELGGEKVFVLHFIQCRDPALVNKPFFAKYCIECHNADKAKSGYNLDGFEALRGHRLGEPGELGEPLHDRRTSHEAAAALEPEHEPVALQLSERLPRRDAADRVLASELVLGREAIEWPVDAALDPFPKQIGQLLVQRSRSARGEARAARLRRLVRLCHIKHAQPVEQPMCHSRLALLSVSRCSPQRGVPLT